MSDEPPNPRWVRSQRFGLSKQARTIVSAYRAGITAAGTSGDHGAFARASEAWAKQYELKPDDGMYLAELERTPVTLAELGEALAVCSQSRDDVSRCIKRLVRAGFVVVIPAS